jgi:hypothetical protein
MKKKNYWIDQTKKQASASNITKPKSKALALDTLPIIQVLEKSSKDEQHFNETYAYAQKCSDPNSTDIQRVYLTMRDTLAFNLSNSKEVESLTQKGELLELASFPNNWKTIALSDLTHLLNLDLDEDDEDEDEFDDMTPRERFDFIYEHGLKLP